MPIRLLAGTASCITVLALIGWLVDVTVLTSVLPDVISMKSATAVAVALMAAG